jgi:hypothetical protein
MGNDREALINRNVKYYNEIFVESIKKINSYLLPSYNLSSYQYRSLNVSYDNITNFIDQYHSIKKYFRLTENPEAYINVYLNFVDYIRNYIFYNSFYIDYELERIKRELNQFKMESELEKEKVD